MLQFAALSSAPIFLSLDPKFTLPFSSSAPITRMCTQKGSDQHHETVHAGASHGTSGTGHHFSIPSRVHRRRKPAFLNCSTAGVHSRGRVKPDSPLPPPQDGTPVNPSPPPRLHPLEPFSSCLATPRQQEPRHTRPTPLLLLSLLSPSSPSPSPPNVAVMSLARPGPVVPPEPTTRDDRLDRLELSQFSSPSCPDAIDVIAPPAHRDAQGWSHRRLSWAFPDHVAPGEPPLPPFLTKHKENRQQCAC